MSSSISVQEYVALQPKLAWRRKLMRGILIRGLGFGVLWDVKITGTENIPDTGPGILMMNHISLLDPVLCMGAVMNRFVVPMTKVENMRNPILAPLINWWGAYSINRGEVDRRALTNSIELLKSGQLILMAPEGTRQRDGLAKPKDGLAYLATKADAVIIPAAISGAIGWQQKMQRLQRPHIQLNFGRPFRFKTDGGARVPREALAQMGEEAMYQLALTLKDESMRGVYSDIGKATTDYLDFITP